MSFDFLKSAKKSFLDRLALSQKSFEPIDLTDNATLITRETRPPGASVSNQEGLNRLSLQDIIQQQCDQEN